MAMAAWNPGVPWAYSGQPESWGMFMFLRRFTRLGAVIAILAIASTFAVETLARPGGGGSFGSRGSRSSFTPPVTNTAPRSAQPLPRTNSPGPSTYAPQPQRSGGFLSSGLGRGLVGGFLGAGLFGLLSGNGFFGGLGNGLSFIGLLIQIGIVVLIVRFLMGMFRNRQSAVGGPASGYSQGGPGFGRPNGFGGSPSPRTTPLQLDGADFDMFQRRLGEIQGAFSAEDVATLRRLATPEMANQFAGELGDHQRNNVINRLSNITLLQGDLSEAWREEAREYATLAMRYSLIDVIVDRASGRVVSGNPNRPDEVTELWTFVRPSGNVPAAWTLSAIQQT